MAVAFFSPVPFRGSIHNADNTSSNVIDFDIFASRGKSSDESITPASKSDSENSLPASLQENSDDVGYSFPTLNIVSGHEVPLQSIGTPPCQLIRRNDIGAWYRMDMHSWNKKQKELIDKGDEVQAGILQAQGYSTFSLKILQHYF